MSTRYRFFLFLILAFGAMAFFLFFTGSPLNPLPSAEVLILQEGFEPQRLQISRGTKVVFINKDEKPHWPASDFHPTHEEYPSSRKGCIGSDFDACQGIGPGGRYEFVFTRKGRWGVHDHLYPALTTTIEVVDEAGVNRPIRSTLSPFNGKLPDQEEFLGMSYDRQLALIKEASGLDPIKTWNYLKETFIRNQEVRGNPHTFAHLAGNALYQKFGIAGIAECDSSFAYGCQHGVTEMMLKNLGADSLPKAQKECLSLYASEKILDYTGCFHGMGHGLLSWRSYNVVKALEDCKLLNEPYRRYCFDGVFMEQALAGVNKEFDFGNPWASCAELAEEFHYNCARYQFRVFMNKGLDTAATALACEKAPKAILKETCLAGLGHFAAQKAQGNKKQIQNICGQISSVESRYVCLKGASQEVVFQKYEKWEETARALFFDFPPSLENR